MIDDQEPPQLGPDATLPDGCTCTMIGEGRAHGTLAFWINAGCPLHGPKPDQDKGLVG